MSRHDARYEATPQDVRFALRARIPDPWGRNEHPWTEFLIACSICELRGLTSALVGDVLKLNKLRELLATMAEQGLVIARTRAEWAALGREPPSRMKDLLYASVELARHWETVDAYRNENGGRVLPRGRASESRERTARRQGH